MKKKFGLFALVLTVLLCGSLFLFAACGDGEEEEPSATPAISVTVNETARQSGATIEGDTEDTYTIAASVVNGEEGASVTISYVYESGEAEDFSGSTFSPREAGTYVFTFTAEGASNFTLTFEIAEAQAPVVPVITASADRNEITAGGQVTLTWSATENAQVTVTYTKDGESASALQPESGVAFTIAEAGKYVFTFAAEGAQSVDVTVTVTAAHTHVWATEWTIKPATATEEGKASRACIASGCTDPVEVQEVTLPALNSDEAEDFYTVTVKTPATCTEKGVSTYAWVSNDDIAFDVTGEVSYEQSAHTDLAYVAAVAPTCTDAGKIAHAYCEDCGKYYNVTGDASSYTIGEEITEGAAGLTGDPATGHSYAVSFDTEEDYTTALGMADGQYMVDCANECGTETTIALPVLTAENTWTKSEEVAATCMNPGTATFTATVSSVTVVVKGVQTAPATGHSYEVSYEGTSLSAVCEKGDSTVTATVTISGGDGATGTTEFGSDAFSFADGTFTVTLPQNAFEKEGFSFSGWLVGEETKQAGDSATVAENGTLVITAQWTEDEVPVTPVITLSVTLGGKPVEGVVNNGSATVCVGTEIGYAVTVTGGGSVTGVYIYEDGEAVDLGSATGTFTFANAGTYVFTFSADGADPYTYTVNVVAHSYGAAAVDTVTGNIIQTCTICNTETQTLATLTGLSVEWAEEAQGWYAVNGQISVSDFVVTPAYSADVSSYTEIIAAAITNNISHLNMSQTGLVTVTFTLGNIDASIDVMVYAANETNGAKVLSAKEGTVTAALNTGYDVAPIPNASADGFAVSFWMTDNTNSDWTAIVIGGKDSILGFDITLPNLDPNDYGGEWATNANPYAHGHFHNGATHTDILRTPSFVTVSVDGVNGVSYYLNGVLQVRYETTDALANGKLVSEFVTILTGGAVTDGIQFAFGLVTQDLYVTNGLTDAQALAIFEAYKASELYPFVALNTEALLNGISGVTVFESADASFDTDAIYRLSAIENVATTGLSVSFNLPAVVADEWAAIVIGTDIDIDVTLACLDAFGNTSGSIPSSNSAPATEQAQYFKGAYGWVTVTLETDGDITFYCNGTQVAQIAGAAYVYDFTIKEVSTSVTVADVITVIFNEVATDGCDLLQAVAADDLLVTSALDAAAAKTLSDNYASLNA